MIYEDRTYVRNELKRRAVSYRTIRPKISTVPSSLVDQACRESNWWRMGLSACKVDISPAAAKIASILGMMWNWEIAVRASIVTMKIWLRLSDRAVPRVAWL